MNEMLINGFLVEKPPSLLERITLPRDNDMAIPRFVDGEIHQKLFVYKKDNGTWGIQVRDMIKSDLGFEFKTQMETFDVAQNLLMMRYL